MTDKEKLDKLVAEIERRITFFKKQSVRKTTTDDNSCALALQGVLCFYDSLQKEPIFKVGDTIQKKDDNSIRYFIINKTSDGYRALRGLSDTIVIWFSEQDQWKLVEEPVSEELEEAATKYMKSENPPIWGLHEGFIAGANWQKEKMMKEAIEGIARPDDSEIWCNLSSFNLKDGDKVRVVVIKED